MCAVCAVCAANGWLGECASVTLSVHRYGPGYFPGTGNVESTGSGNGAGYSCNVPLKPGIGDERYVKLVCPILDAARGALQPAAVVLQCGADALSRDPLGELNLSSAVIVGTLCRFMHQPNYFPSASVYIPNVRRLMLFRVLA